MHFDLKGKVYWGFDIPRNARLDGFDTVDLMPARHRTSVGRMIDERIMAERRVALNNDYVQERDAGICKTMLLGQKLTSNEPSLKFLVEN